MKLKYKLFAIDFDNTIVYDAYPKIGNLIPGAKETMLKIKELGGLISIWTCRSGKHELMVKDFLDSNNIPYDYINESFEENVIMYGGDTRKVYADCYIDDKSLHFGGEPVDWDLVQSLIFTYEHQEWDIGDTIECLEDCMKNFIKGEKYEIEYIDQDTDYISFGPVSGTSISYVKEYFKRVK